MPETISTEVFSRYKCALFFCFCQRSWARIDPKRLGFAKQKVLSAVAASLLPIPALQEHGCDASRQRGRTSGRHL